MKKNNEKPTPLLLGADLNAYSVAVAFHEAYGVKSYAMGRYRCGLTEFSKIVKMQFCSGYESIDVFLPELFSFAEKHKGEELVLVPCADCYVEFVNKYEKELSPFYKFLVPDAEVRERLCDKIEFYKAIEKFGLPYPDFIPIYSMNFSEKDLNAITYPAILKPSSSAEYWKHPFPGMRKVYHPRDSREAYEIIKEIYYYGYKGGLLLQRKIEKPEIYVYTVFINSAAKTDFGVFGKVVLEECGKTSEGNHSAIITEEGNSLCEKLKEFLEKEGYRGFANFDILLSGGKYYILELNARQGRSCDHIRCAGINIAKQLMNALKNKEDDATKDKLYDKDKPYRRIFWHYPTRKTVMRYMENEEDRKNARILKKAGEDFSALDYLPDLIFNPLRSAYVAIHHNRLAKTFEKDFKELKSSQERG